MEFDSCQLKAVNQLQNGNILCGDVGSGKSRVSLVYYYTKICDGSLEPCSEYEVNIKPASKLVDLYIITTAKKRDSDDWERESIPFSFAPKVVDSWNNINKYRDVKDAFFIFDEQRLVGSGAWVKAFYEISKKNRWILLSATPGDTWSDFIPVFVANGFYKNKTAFLQRHAVYDRFSKYPKVNRWLEEIYLSGLRNQILVDIEYKKNTTRHYKDIDVLYDKETFRYISKERYDIFKNEPIKDASGLCYALRRVVNENPYRIKQTLRIVNESHRVIIFYNFDYELELLRKMCEDNNLNYSEWNGHNHQEIPDTDEWVYLVQYTAGAEGWNCITTDTIIFYSLNYSYKITMQSAGRIDRRNTKYTDLYFYFLKTTSWIDRAVKNSLNSKRDFNESRYISKYWSHENHSL